MNEATEPPKIPSVGNLALMNSEAPYGVKETDRWSKRYRGEWKISGEDGAETVSVIVEVVPLAAVAKCRSELERTNAVSKLAERVKKLVGRPMPHVAPVLAAGELASGDYYAVRPDLEGVSLQSDQGHQTLGRGELVASAEQLLRGLAALHDADISFGDFRLEDVRLAKSEGGGSPALWLTGAEFGALNVITDGCIERRSGNNGADPQQAGKKPGDDLQRFGEIVCQLAGGASKKSSNAKIKDKSLRKLVTACLSTAGKRPDDARQALKKLNNIRKSRSRNLALVAGGLLALAATLIGLQLWSLASRKDDANVARNGAEKRAETLQQENQRLEQDKQKLAQENQRLEQDKTELEKELLNRGWEPPTGTDPPLDDQYIRAEATKLFSRYYDENTPGQEIDRWLDAELDGRSPREISPIKQKIKVFENALQGGNTSYTLRLKTAATNDAAHKDRNATWRLTVYVDGNNVVEKFFQPAKASELEAKFNWKPKQSIQVLVEGDWALWYPNRDNLLDVTYIGDYALWQLHRELQALSRKSTTVTGEISDFPQTGPDRKAVKPIPGKAP